MSKGISEGFVLYQSVFGAPGVPRLSVEPYTPVPVDQLAGSVPLAVGVVRSKLLPDVSTSHGSKAL